MIKHFRSNVDREDAFDHAERDVHTAVTPSKLHEILQSEDGAALPVCRLTDGSVQVVVERVDEAFSSPRAGRVQSDSEPEGGESSANER